MERWVGSVALVTGASAGLGEAIAEKLVEQGIKVVGVARRKEKLDVIAKKLSCKKGKFYGVQGDVTKEEDIIKAFKWTKENVGPVSILVNNAGVAAGGPLATIATKDMIQSLNINVLGLSIATREAIAQMNEKKIAGHIVHINSITGHKVTSLDNMGFYTASKHAVTALAESLRLELGKAGSKIKITSISPGAIKTDLLEGLMEGIMANVPKEALEGLKNIATLEAADVADAIVLVLSTPKHVQIPELTIQAVGEVA